MRSVVAVLLSIAPVFAADPAPQDPLELAKRPFIYGREYFVLRSGRAELIAQADRVDLGPAFTFLLFDPQNARQSARKDRAFNFDPAGGFASSALQVELSSGYRFTALGHTTTTGWALADGIPAVQATWWAGGVRVTEQILALATDGVFLRSIRLEGADLVGAQPVTLHLALPPGTCQGRGAALVQARKGVTLGLGVLGNVPVRSDEAAGKLAIGPVSIEPHAVVDIRTVLAAKIPPVQPGDLLAWISGFETSDYPRLLEATAKSWAGKSTLATKDATIQELYDKARFGLPGMIADDGTMNAGIFEYGGQWVRDTSNTVLGALHTGEFELARNTLQRVLTSMVTAEGVTMIAGGFDQPDREQFDQMGELLHVMKAYRDWTGDESLIREHRDRLRIMVERPLRPEFRDETGMVHNRREFWERTFLDAYELIYQAYVVQGLRDAADLAVPLGAEDRAERWRAEADRTLKAILSHPTRALVDDGRLIKRRNLTGEVADLDPDLPQAHPDAPATTEVHHRLLPDASEALVIALGIVDPRSDLARRTLDDLEKLRNARWSDGGYDRYHTSTQLDQPGPWSFATCFILRAQHDAGLFDRSRRTLDYLNTVQGGRTGSWFEEIPLIRSNEQACGVLPWTSAEVTLFVVRHWLGVRFEGDSLVLAPALYPGSPPVSADLRFRKSRLSITVDGAGPVRSATVNGKEMAPDKMGRLVLPRDFEGGTIAVQAGKN